MEKMYYDNSCPNCYKVITNERLEKGLPCEKCLPEEKENIEEIYNNLTEKLEYSEIYEKYVKTKEFSEFFKKLLNNEPWSIQKMWFWRLEKGESFSIVAPTGVGKTTFIITYTIFKRKKSLIILPTSVLVEQVYNKFKELSDLKVIRYSSKMSKKEKEEFVNEIPNADVIIITAQFLTRKWELLLNQNFKYIFIDDVDAFLKSSRNIDKLFRICGFSEEILKKAYEYLFKLIRGKLNIDEIKEFQKTLPEHPQVIVSSATGSMRGIKSKLFRVLLNFDIGYSRANIRNVLNVFCGKYDINKIIEIIKKLGKMGIIYTKLKDDAIKLEEELRNKGINAVLEEDPHKIIEIIEQEKADVLIGVATYYGKLVRGIDFPEKIKYVIFTELPHFKLKLDEETFKELKQGPLLYIFSILSKEKPELRIYLSKIRRNKYDINELWNVVKENIDILKSQDTFTGEYLLIPDFKTYVQGSGRTSRAVAGGLTKGVAFLFWSNDNLAKKFDFYIKTFLEEEIKTYEEINFEALKKELEESRKERKEKKELTKSLLFIVESPTKAKTIAKFFGQPSRRHFGNMVAYETTSGKYIITVIASIGHVYDLIPEAPIKPELYGVVNYKEPYFAPIKKCLNCGEQYTGEKCRKCGSTECLSSLDRIKMLRKLALESDLILIGTDPDAEGEKIAYDLYLALKPYCKEIYRVEFHEVTKRAIMKALEQRNKINYNRVLSQVIRRIEDRWIGFSLSQLLQKEFNDYNLSAGRVQTPVLGWIIERYYQSKKSMTKFGAVILENNYSIVFEDFKKTSQNYVEYEVLEEYEKELKPLPPYTTDTILTDAQEKLKLSASETMRILQDLFEHGLCTYHRTDSTHVSSVGIEIAKGYLEMKNLPFKPRTWGEEGAHECIRPTRMLDVNDLINYIASGDITLYTRFTSNHYKVYNLIFKRFIASQMPEAKVKVKKIRWIFDNNVKEEELITEIIEEGWLKINPIRVVELPRSPINVKDIRIWRGPKIPLYSEGEIIKRMKEEEIGRPSTYATIMTKLFKRFYIIRSKNNQKLIPTKKGIQVYNYLESNYHNLISVNRTRELEKKMDLVEEKPELYDDLLEELKKEVEPILELIK
jgi:reverse gyrase